MFTSKRGEIHRRLGRKLVYQESAVQCASGTDAGRTGISIAVHCRRLCRCARDLDIQTIHGVTATGCLQLIYQVICFEESRKPFTVICQITGIVRQVLGIDRKNVNIPERAFIAVVIHTSGVQFTIRIDYAGHKLAVVFITSGGTVDHKLNCLNAGSDFLFQSIVGAFRRKVYIDVDRRIG